MVKGLVFTSLVYFTIPSWIQTLTLTGLCGLRRHSFKSVSGKRQQPVSLNKYSHSNLRHRDEVCFLLFVRLCVCVRICFFPNLKRTIQSTSGLVFLRPFLRSNSLTTSPLNHPLISSTSFFVSKKLEQINITMYTTIWDSSLAKSSYFMDKVWTNCHGIGCIFDFKHAAIGFCVWGTSEVINYHSLSALVKAAAAFHRGHAGSYIKRGTEIDLCTSQWCFTHKPFNQSAEVIKTSKWMLIHLCHWYFPFFLKTTIVSNIFPNQNSVYWQLSIMMFHPVLRASNN